MTDLVKRSKKGDKTAFALLMDAHRQLGAITTLLPSATQSAFPSKGPARRMLS